MDCWSRDGHAVGVTFLTLFEDLEIYYLTGQTAEQALKEELKRCQGGLSYVERQHLHFAAWLMRGRPKAEAALDCLLNITWRDDQGALHWESEGKGQSMQMLSAPGVSAYEGTPSFSPRAGEGCSPKIAATDGFFSNSAPLPEHLAGGVGDGLEEEDQDTSGQLRTFTLWVPDGDVPQEGLLGGLEGSSCGVSRGGALEEEEEGDTWGTGCDGLGASGPHTQAKLLGSLEGHIEGGSGAQLQPYYNYDVQLVAQDALFGALESESDGDMDGLCELSQESLLPPFCRDRMHAWAPSRVPQTSCQDYGPVHRRLLLAAPSMMLKCSWSTTVAAVHPILQS